MATCAAPDVDVLAALGRLARYRGGRALVPVAELGEVLDLPQEEALDLAASLEADGWLETWTEDPDGPAVILSGRAADRLDLELHPPGDSDFLNCRWFRRGRVPESKPGKSSTVVGALEVDLYPGHPSGDNPGLDSLADPKALDPAANALAALIEAETATVATPQQARQRLHDRMFLGAHDPKVRHFHGLREPCFPLAPDEDGHCGCCHNVALRVDAMCLQCNRVGALEAGVARLATPAEMPSKKWKPDEALDGGKGYRRLTRSQIATAEWAGRVLDQLHAQEAKPKPAAPFLDRQATARKARTRRAQRKADVKAKGNSFDLATLKSALGP
jgi:hypothetical protein